MLLLVGKEESRLKYDMNRFRRAKAFVISMLGEFSEICQTKQVVCSYLIVDEYVHCNCIYYTNI